VKARVDVIFKTVKELQILTTGGAAPACKPYTEARERGIVISLPFGAHHLEMTIDVEAPEGVLRPWLNAWFNDRWSLISE
jgi:hypothetical protein